MFGHWLGLPNAPMFSIACRVIGVITKWNFGQLKKVIKKFLDIYQSEPQILDPDHPLHKNKYEVYDGWIRIKEKMKIEVSIQDLKKKLESLMAASRTHMRKVVLIIVYLGLYFDWNGIYYYQKLHDF
ncbi:hypothetical protein Anas_02881 [Armadillidium nasatum]|uniref:MADF domain-containing protein n=1 Tax=Armadillidium nasatum TaxID=96803 RepID=A0A5N5SWL9_9CRUS|nr:hypothetical protein Anas_02881 [Armadillidium nasatum]